MQAEGPHSAAAFTELQERTRQLQGRGAAAAARLEQQRQQVAEAAAAAKVGGTMWSGVVGHSAQQALVPQERASDAVEIGCC